MLYHHLQQSQRGLTSKTPVIKANLLLLHNFYWTRTTHGTLGLENLKIHCKLISNIKPALKCFLNLFVLKFMLKLAHSKMVFKIIFHVSDVLRDPYQYIFKLLYREVGNQCPLRRRSLARRGSERSGTRPYS